MREQASPIRTPIVADHASDRVIIAKIWPLLIAAVVGLLPFTAFSTFLVPISATAGAQESVVGGLRGLGGVTALLTGVIIAPLLERWSPRVAAPAALVLLAIASLLAATGSLVPLVLFCLLVGTATALLTPVLLAGAARSFTRAGDGGRAATLVTATQTLAAVLAAPLLGALALAGGWRIPFGAVALLALLTACALAVSSRASSATRGGASGQQHAPPRYLQAFRLVKGRRDLLAAIGVSTMRTTAFMGQLAFLAAVYDQRFGLQAELFTVVWTLSGAAFFLGNYLAGRWARQVAGSRRRTLMLLASGTIGGLAALPVVVLVPGLGAALAGTAVLSFSHAVLAAGVTTLIAQHGGELTSVTFSLNAAGQSLGVFLGAAVGGLGLALAGLPGLVIALSAPMLLALGMLTWMGPAGASAEPAETR